MKSQGASRRCRFRSHRIMRVSEEGEFSNRLKVGGGKFSGRLLSIARPFSHSHFVSHSLFLSLSLAYYNSNFSLSFPFRFAFTLLDAVTQPRFRTLISPFVAFESGRARLYQGVFAVLDQASEKL